MVRRLVIAGSVLIGVFLSGSRGAASEELIQQPNQTGPEAEKKREAERNRNEKNKEGEKREER